MSNKHAALSPSSALKWFNCPGSARMEQLAGKESGVNFKYADEGTAAHFLASEALEDGLYKIPQAWQKRSISVSEDGAKWYVEPDDPRSHLYVTPEMVENVNTYLTELNYYKGEEGLLRTEFQLSIEFITGETEAVGTADAVIIRGDQLQIHDLKYGRTEVEAEENLQLLLYAIAAYDEFRVFENIQSVVMVIHQPRLESVSEWTVEVTTLMEWLGRLQEAASYATEALKKETVSEVTGYLTIGPHCNKGYCKAAAVCPVLNGLVESTVGEVLVTDGKICGIDDVFNLADLGKKAERIPLLLYWTQAVTERLNTEVLNGSEVPGFKVVMGRKGNRKWDDETIVEQELKSMKIGVDTIYAKKLNSPTILEKAAQAGDIGPRQWTKIKEHVYQEPAQLTVVPESDKRQAIKVSKGSDALEGFDNLDLFN